MCLYYLIKHAFIYIYIERERVTYTYAFTLFIHIHTLLADILLNQLKQ